MQIGKHDFLANCLVLSFGNIHDIAGDQAMDAYLSAADKTIFLQHCPSGTIEAVERNINSRLESSGTEKSLSVDQRCQAANRERSRYGLLQCQNCWRLRYLCNLKSDFQFAEPLGTSTQGDLRKCK